MGPAADTIAAISTPPIPAAIGILRLSGPRAAQIAAVCFKPLGRKGLLEHRPHELVYGDLLDTEGAVIDRVLCTFSLAPHSYTGEDTAEIHCHGAPMVLQLGLAVSSPGTLRVLTDFTATAPREKPCGLCIYIARSGETLFSVGEELGIAPQELAQQNPGLDEGAILESGTRITVYRRLRG